MNKIKRSSFLKTMFAGAVALQLPFVFSCNTADISNIELIISDRRYSINNTDLKIIIDVLIPDSDIGPGAVSFKADTYFYWLLADTKVDLSRRRNLAASISRINKFAVDKYNASLQNLSQKDLQEVIKVISQTSWGETDLSLLMTVCFEAMFANSVYDCNPENKAWQWLGYMGGIPFPSVNNKYPEIMKINHLK